MKPIHKFIACAVLIMVSVGCGRSTNTVGPVLPELEKHLVAIGLLDPQEAVLGFTTNHNDEEARAFFTNKRIAWYWLNEKDTTQNSKHSAYYPEISTASLTLSNRWDDAHFITIKTIGANEFNAYLGGSKEFAQSFFDEFERERKAKAIGR